MVVGYHADMYVNVAMPLEPLTCEGVSGGLETGSDLNCSAEISQGLDLSPHSPHPFKRSCLPPKPPFCLAISFTLGLSIRFHRMA